MKLPLTFSRIGESHVVFLVILGHFFDAKYSCTFLKARLGQFSLIPSVLVHFSKPSLVIPLMPGILVQFSSPYLVNFLIASGLGTLSGHTQSVFLIPSSFAKCAGDRAEGGQVLLAQIILYLCAEDLMFSTSCYRAMK